MSKADEIEPLGRYFRFLHRPYSEFGSSLEIRIGWLNLNFSRYEDHVYAHFLWARPIRNGP